MTVCAVVQLDNNLVINRIVAEVTDLPPQNCVLIELTDSRPCNIGWIWNGVSFDNPDPPQEQT